MKKKDLALIDEVFQKSWNKLQRLKMKRDWEEKDFNTLVITGPANFSGSLMRIGRVVQVRKESGQFGSDVAFIRHAGEKLMTHENQAFWVVEPEEEEMIKHLIPMEPEGRTYTFGYMDNKQPETGFIVASKIKEGETTPMREVKKGIINALSKL